MKRYLNAREKHESMVLAIVKDFLDKTTSEWEKHGIAGNQRKYARTASTFIGKCIEEMWEDIDKEEIDALRRSSSEYQLEVMFKSKAAIARKKQMEAESVEIVDSEDFLDLVGYAVTNCVTCSEASESCYLRKILMKHEINAFDQYAVEAVCQYNHSNDTKPQIGESYTFTGSAFIDLEGVNLSPNNRRFKIDSEDAVYKDGDWESIYKIVDYKGNEGTITGTKFTELTERGRLKYTTCHK